MKLEKFNKAIKTYLPAINLIVFSLIFLAFFHPVTILGDSMENTLVSGDFGFVLRDWVLDEYDNGDIVIIQSDRFSVPFVVKRIIATAGQTVDINNETGAVIVDGVALNEAYALGSAAGRATMQFPLTIEPGHVFLLGDNREDSYDSRFISIGQIPVEDIFGKLMFLVFPGYDGGYDFSRIGRVN